ncbi:MAG: hypothetical protein N2037_13300 [Acidimicrobiales bacterium]|nr:hypothetical protein [Acidimicrobiales bacterium]
MSRFDGSPPVDAFDVRKGRGLGPDDVGDRVVVLDVHFAKHYGLPPEGELGLSGDARVRYVGHVLQPEHFMIMGEHGSFLAEAGFAVVFTSLETVQHLSGKVGEANEMVVRFVSGVDRAAARSELEAAFANAVPGVTAEFMPIEQERAFRLLYDDLEGDQRFYNIFAALILCGAAFAAFNLVSRIVESQRREIGIGMVLGVPPRWLAARPLLVAAEIAVLGVALGIVVGLVLGALMSGVMQAFFPMPVWETSLQVGIYVTGALAGVGLVLVTSLIPVVRAVRVPPIDAVGVGIRETTGSGLAGAARWLPLPGNTVIQFPFRNVLRNPRRTLLTGMGIAAAIATLI